MKNKNQVFFRLYFDADYSTIGLFKLRVCIGTEKSCEWALFLLMQVVRYEACGIKDNIIVTFGMIPYTAVDTIQVHQVCRLSLVYTRSDTVSSTSQQLHSTLQFLPITALMWNIHTHFTGVVINRL